MIDERIAEEMCRPGFYPHRPPSVELVQTHISFIFLAGDYVFKVKKPVDFGFLDFTTLELRKFFCEEELRLNQRLAPRLYLDVVEITESAAGGLELAGRGRVVDYAVKMRRLPEERMLKRLLAAGEAGPDTMDRVAETLASFHALAETGGDIDRIGGVDAVRVNWEENFAQTEPFVGRTIQRDQFDFLRGYVGRFLARRLPLLERRSEQHRIRDCHGDVHLEHICILPDAVEIFDCIEFNERFRYSDVASEVAFLAMDLDFNGYTELGRRFVDGYVRLTADAQLPLLLDFYRCYRAYVRGKVIGFRLDDPAIDEDGKREAESLARRYFDLAFSYAARLERPTLVILAGLMGTGKSVLARRLAGLLGVEVVSTDVVRKQMLGIDPREHHLDRFGGGIYTPETTLRTYAAALELASTALSEGRSVILDASFRHRAERELARVAASSAGADFFVVECTAPEDVVKERLNARMERTGEASDGRWDLYHQQKADYQAIDEFPPDTHLVVDCSRDSEWSVHEVVRKLRLVED